jgi:hypothetical protein
MSSFKLTLRAPSSQQIDANFTSLYCLSAAKSFSWFNAGGQFEHVVVQKSVLKVTVQGTQRVGVRLILTPEEMPITRKGLTHQ